MIEIRYLRDCEDSGRRLGTCAGCGRDTEDDPGMIRMVFGKNMSGHVPGTTVCLCRQCCEGLYRKMTGIMEAGGMQIITTDGLEEEIRCTLCCNPVKTDSGCDGGCMFDEALHDRLMEIIERRTKTKD